MITRHRTWKGIQRLKILSIVGIVLVLVIGAIGYGINRFGSNPTNTRHVNQPTEQKVQTQPKPSTAQDQPSNSSGSLPESTTTPKLTVTISALSAHIRSQVGYEIDVTANANLGVAGTCKITFAKQGSESVIKQLSTQPDPGTDNTTCYFIQLAALYKSGSWEYYMTPGTWTVTVEVTGNGTTGSTSSMVDLVQM